MEGRYRGPVVPAIAAPHIPRKQICSRPDCCWEQGGFGITYLAADLREYRKLDLKEYFPSSFATRDADRHTVTYAGPGNRAPYQYGLKKFEEEGQTLQKFQHHLNIISVITSFKANGTGYIVMEYLDGTNLLAYLKRQTAGKISFEEALRILTPIMDALREVHRAGVIHRDVSPDNIYLCRSGRIKLLDFGAARLALRDQTQSQQLILKPGYTPEEQYRNSGVAGPFTDVYSLAATMLIDRSPARRFLRRGARALERGSACNRPANWPNCRLALKRR